MPLYDYECQKCGTVEEVQHTVSEIGKIEILCNECDLPMKKMLSVPALIGFDNVGRSRGRKDKEESSATGSSTTGSSSTGSSKSESKKSGPEKSGSPKNGSTPKSTTK